MNNNYYKLGSYNYICVRCGQKYKAEQLRTEWTGLTVCENCYDPKHPWNEPLPVPIEMLPVPVANPRGRTVNVPVPYTHMGVWGQYYLTKAGYVPSLKWEGWDIHWGGDDTATGDDTIFPLL